MLITDQHSVHFGSLHLFCLLQSTSVLLGPFNLLRPIQSNSIYFGLFSLLRSIWSILVYFGSFCPIWSILVHLANLVHSVHFNLFGPIWSIRSIQVYSVQFGLLQSIWSILDHFGPNWCTYLRMEKIQIWVESIINCNYMISFDYHDNLLKRTRI